MMHTRLLAVALAGGAALVGCGDSDFPNNKCSDITTGTCIEIAGGDVAGLLDATNSLSADTTIILGKGTFAMTNELTISTSGFHLIGQGIDTTTLDFGDLTVQSDGIAVTGDDFLVQDLTVLDSPKDGIRVSASNGVVFRRIRATWTNESLSTNGAYGIYPVRSQNVLVEDSFAENAADAGLYVGQCQNVIVRNNTVRGNVAGLEIENTQYADVYGNLAEDNTAGIVVFDLPKNPVVGRDVRLRDNRIINNNRPNFAPGGTVALIPRGTGTFAMASRRVEITGNTYDSNLTVDIAILNGLTVDQDMAKWDLDPATLVGDWEDLGLLPGTVDGMVSNYRSENIVIAGNTHDDDAETGSGTNPDPEGGEFGFLLRYTYPDSAVDSVLYDSVGETFHQTDASMNTNNNHICVGGNTDGTFASMDAATQDVGTFHPFFVPAAPFAPYDCTTLIGGPVEAVVLP
jgi:parallel beta-helix repeat protein